MRTLLVGAVARVTALLAIVAAVGLLPLLTGRDPALAVLRARSADREPDAEAIASVRHELGLDAGPVDLLLRRLGEVSRGDLGRSWVSGESVSAQVGSAIAVSATLTAFAAAVAVLVMALLVRRPLLRRPRGRGTVAAVLAALPEFLIGSVLLVVVAVRLGWLPTSGWQDPRNAVLPAIALGVPAGAVLGVVAGDAVREAAAEPWLRTWEGAGMRRRTITSAVLRRAASVVAGQLGLVVAGVFGGAAAVEVVFAVPGIGRLAVTAATAQDVPVVQASVLVVLVVGALAGAAGSLARRLLLGPAFAEGALVGPPPSTRPAGRPVSAIVASATLAVLVVAGLFRDPLAVHLASRLSAPSVRHPLGTDALGRDVLARLAHGAAATVALAVAVTAAVIMIGVLVGLLARRGVVVADLVNALPPVMVAVVVAATTGPGRWSAVIAVGATAWAPLASHARALATEQRRSQHLAAAKALGAGRWHLVTRHVLPAIVPPVVRNAFVRLPAVALALASLGYLGLGAQPPAPDWGMLLAEGVPYFERAPWVVAFPVAGLIALGVCAVALADRLR